MFAVIAHVRRQPDVRRTPSDLDILRDVRPDPWVMTDPLLQRLTRGAAGETRARYE